MPYASEKQRKFIYAKHPAIAKRWDKEGKNYVEKKMASYERRRKKKKAS